MKQKNIEVYRDNRYILGIVKGLASIIISGNEYKLTCHPYEPCLYITDKRGRTTAVHNSFDPVAVFERFQEGRTVTSITGFEYTAEDFCRMVDYAANMTDIQIDEAEKIFGDRTKHQKAMPENKKKEKLWEENNIRAESGMIIKNDPFFDLIHRYPDSVIDFCLVMNEHREATGYHSHWAALTAACNRLFVDDNETIWHYNVGKADAMEISTEELFASEDKSGDLNYRMAFLSPPHTNSYQDEDFDRMNAVLFPNGTKDLEVYKWTTDWSEYFDDGHEWWGTLCLTVYDKSLDRFVVIMASATD